MQLTTFTAFLAFTIAGIAAAPGYSPPPPPPAYAPPPAPPVYAPPPAPPAYAPPPTPPSAPKYAPPIAPPRPSRPAAPAPPTFNQQSNTCSSGSPFCCSPANSGGLTAGTTCKYATTQCDSTTICCNNNAQDSASATQNCGGLNSLQQPITWNFAGWS